jgi:signal transduction histidine kinase
MPPRICCNLRNAAQVERASILGNATDNSGAAILGELRVEGGSHARTRNLFASLVLVGLLGGAAWALVQYTGRSRRLSDMQFRFAAGVSHDLRTPLTAIRGAAFNVAEGIVAEPVAIRRYAKLILRNAEELTSMIENVLAFSTSLHPG